MRAVLIMNLILSLVVGIEYYTVLLIPTTKLRIKFIIKPPSLPLLQKIILG